MLRQNIEVTQDKKLVNPAIHVVQGDTGRTVVALVKDATISGTATMAFERPDGATYTTTATVNSDNSVEATFTADMLRVAGTGKATFKVVSSGSQVSTYQLYVLVEPSAGFERPITPSNNKIYVYVNGSPVEVATATEVATKASQSQVDGISATVNNLVGRIVEDESNIAINAATLRNKMNKVRIDFDGTNFKIGTRTLNYKELYDIHISNPDFGFVVYGDRAYLLSYVQDGAGMKEMRFQSTIATTDSSNLSYTKTSGIYVTSSDGINIASVRVADINSENKSYKATEFTEANKNSDIWYPSNKAVNNVVSELKDELNVLSDVTTVTNTLKNICDNSKLESGFINFTNGTVSPHSTYIHSDYVPVKAGYKYLARCQQSHFAFYDVAKEYIANNVNDITHFNGIITRGFSDNANCYGFIPPQDGFVRVSGVGKILIVIVDDFGENTSSVNANDTSLNYSIRPVFEDKIEDIIPKLEEVYLKFFDTTNLANKAEFKIGIIDQSDVLHTDSTNYYTTNYIFVKAGDTISSNYQMRRAIALNSDKSAVVKYVENADKYTATVDSWFRCSIFIADDRYDTTMIAKSDTPLPYVPYLNPINYEIGKKKVNIKASEGINAFYEKMTEAFHTGSCYVYIEKGDYIYTNELIDSIRASGLRGVPIGNNCTYYFESGARIICEYTGDNASDVVNLFSPLDTWNRAGDFEIYNLNLSSKNTCYALHDESNGSSSHVKHIYKNCKISLDNSALGTSGNNISKALGGGLGQYEEIIIEDCIFEAINTNYGTEGYTDDASYHGPNNSTHSESNIVVTNCFFRNRFRVSNLGQETTIKSKLIYSSNSSRTTVGVANDWDNKVFCNEIRG